MTLLNDEKDSVINYRIERAFETLEEAKDNCKLGHWNLTANRLYYAVFYMVLAVHLKNGELTKTHNGAYNLFNQKYIKSGALTREEGMLYRKLFSMRHSGDYDDCFDWEKDDILPLIDDVEKLVHKISSLIE